MLPVATIGDSSTFYLARVGGDSGMGGGDVQISEDIILSCFLSQDTCARSCLESIGIGAMCRVKTHLVSGEGLTLKQCGVETHESQKWDPPPTEEAFLIPGRGDIFFINPFWLKA